MTNRDNIALRHKVIDSADHVIIKAGTRLVIGRDAVAKLIDEIVSVRNSGRKVLLVSSGAVGMGLETLGIEKRPRELAKKQALAAIGQSRLMTAYQEEAAKHGFTVAQMLLTAADLNSRERAINVLNCINALWEQDVLPIINENDCVSVDELKFGDNDTLAGMLASLTGAPLTVILTTVTGLLDRDESGKLGERIPVVKKLDDALFALAGGTDDADFSIGGMKSKLRAAEIAGAAGSALIIADGREKNILQDILDCKDTGTLFIPRKRLPGRKRWLGYLSRVSGKILVDEGAAAALKEHGKSLLPSGAVAVEGSFRRGSTIEIADANGTVFARGLSNFDADDCRKLLGCHSGQLHKILGADADEELVHRDNLLLLQ
jgi:glutamate 5-kinase